MKAYKWIIFIFMIIVCFFFTLLTADANPNGALDGSYSDFREVAISADSAPGRIPRYQFSYVFRVEPGQKVIRLHFYPKRSEDLFSVEAGPFTLLSNFSVVNFVTKEFCIVIEENDLLNVTVTGTRAFVERIEVFSVPETGLYCHAGERGVQVVGEKFLVYVDNSTALEIVHRENVKQGSVSSGDDFRGVFRMWGKGNEANSMTWRISVDVGFRYMVRLRFSELGVKMAENGDISFSIAVNNMVVCTNEDVLAKMEDKHGLFYRNFVVMAKGWMLEGKRDIIISLLSRGYGDGPLEGFEIFKLSNHDNSLASPNPLLPATDTTHWMLQDVLDRRSILSAVVVIVISVVNIIIHMLRNSWEANFPEEEKKPATVINRICRCFSLSEIREATKDFSEVRVIGKGGFGKVYKGFIDNGPEIVAVKRLKPDSKQGKQEFWAEVETLSELRHVNLVSLIGYCNEQEEMILVYDYMPNGSLADHLYKLARKNSKCSPLSWEERLEICIGAGRGLDYLHTGKGVLHRDVKASNILLDATFVAKVSDFGLATTENVCGSQNQDTTNLKGTFGYIDPDYFKTRKLTMKSDTYAFGVVLMEVLCGRPAVDPLAGEDGRSLTNWARDKITRGKVDQILAPGLSGGVSPDSLKAFLWIVERCLHDEPNKRPTIAHVVTNLEFTLDQQNGATGFADFVPFTGHLQQSRYLVPKELTNVTAQLEKNVTSLLPNVNTGSADSVPFTGKLQQSKLLVPSDLPTVAAQLETNATSLLPNGITGSADVMPRNDRESMPLTTASFHPQHAISPSKDQSKSGMVSHKMLKDGRKNIKQRLTRLLLFDAIWKKAKAPQKADVGITSVSAPVLNDTGEKKSSASSSTDKKSTKEGGINELLSNPNFRIFSFAELKAVTRNFRPDNVLGEGGFGRVFKGFLKDESTNNNASGRVIAVKRLNDNGVQGLKEWLSEITFLGKLSHPNLVKLLGYCLEDEELLLVYEFMARSSLEIHLFRRGAVQTLPWDIRLKILIGAARGLEYLHTLADPIIYRDFKTSNILLDESYNAKLSDFGLAKSGPSPEHTHVTTRVMGTDGYAAPEYVATGHLTVKSDVYGFGVVLLEMLTGLRVIDKSRPSEQQFLVNWISPHFNRRKKLMSFVDSRLEENYPRKSVFQVYQLAENCLKLDWGGRPSMSKVVKILEGLDKSHREPRIHKHSLINVGLEKEPVEEEGIHVPNILEAEDIVARQCTVAGSFSGDERDVTSISGQQLINGVNGRSDENQDESRKQAEVVRWWWE